MKWWKKCTVVTPMPPIVAINFFACTMGMDVTIKGQGRTQLDEVAVYELRDGKITKEQFLY